MNRFDPWDYSDSYAWMERIGDLPPLIITVAVNGGIQGRESHPRLPETPEEIAEETEKAYLAGASVVHIHARDPLNLGDCAGTPDAYAEVNALVRARCPDIIVNNTTGGGLNTTMDERIRCLDALPEMASLNMGPDMSRFVLPARVPPVPHPREAIEYDVCIPFTYGIIDRLVRSMRERGIKPEMEIFNPGEFWVSNGLIERGLLAPPYYFQFVMGSQTSVFPTPGNLIRMVSELPSGSVFSVVGIGKFQWPMLCSSVILGGHARVGLEDNLYASKGKKLRDNAEAVAKVVRVASELNRAVATPEETRTMLGLDVKPRTYTGQLALSQADVR